jgi:hypothetical protein
MGRPYPRTMQVLRARLGHDCIPGSARAGRKCRSQRGRQPNRWVWRVRGGQPRRAASTSWKSLPATWPGPGRLRPDRVRPVVTRLATGPLRTTEGIDARGSCRGTTADRGERPGGPGGRPRVPGGRRRRRSHHDLGRPDARPRGRGDTGVPVLRPGHRGCPGAAPGAGRRSSWHPPAALPPGRRRSAAGRRGGPVGCRGRIRLHRLRRGGVSPAAAWTSPWSTSRTSPRPRGSVPRPASGYRTG